MPAPDRDATLLLCAGLGPKQKNRPGPLSPAEYSSLFRWLAQRDRSPGHLLTQEGERLLADWSVAGGDSERLRYLIERGRILALLLEKWQSASIWVLVRNEPDYPGKLAAYLGDSAPPVLYGVGPRSLLHKGGLAIVGSRNPSEEDALYARKAGAHCGRQGVTVITGGASGVDRQALSGTLEEGGQAVVVLPEGVARPATYACYREALIEDRLVLVSHYEPEAAWAVYRAMERNRLIYGLSDAALVVACGEGGGGTWSGAMEALQRKRVPVFVKSSGRPAPGNARLLEFGALPFPDEAWADLRSLWAMPMQNALGLAFGESTESAAGEAEEMPATGVASPPCGGAASIGSGVASTPRTDEEVVDSTIPEEQPCDAYTLVIDALVSLLAEPREEKWLAEKMNVQLGQMKLWLKRAVAEKRIEKVRKSSKYIASNPTLFPC